MPLTTAPNFETPDASYAALLAAHEDLSESESHALNARLVLILMNHIGEAALIEEALTLARDTAPPTKIA